MFAIALLTMLSLFIILAMIAVSRYVADRWERRQEARYTSLTSFQQAMERIMNQEQPQ
jgi:hypothetical protein